MAKLTYFISDLHLGASYIASSIEHQRHIVAWLDEIKSKAKAIYLLGDVLDYWYEYRYVVPRGFTRFFGKLAELADSGIEIYWLVGNHDIWIFDYLPQELGVKVIDGNVVKEIDGRRFYLGHGDGVGKRPLGFRIIRSVFRNALAQKLFSAIHPRWTVPFAHNWSSHSRKSCADIEASIERGKKALLEFAREYNATEHVDYFVFGHVHCLEQMPVADGSQLVILGEWIKLYSYAQFDGKNLQLCQFAR